MGLNVLIRYACKYVILLLIIKLVALMIAFSLLVIVTDPDFALTSRCVLNTICHTNKLGHFMLHAC